MFAYFAFKALVPRDDIKVLLSPVIFALWEIVNTPWGKFFYHKADYSNFNAYRGIFAATLDEALKYGQHLYLCAPDPRYGVWVSTRGWCAEGAIVFREIINTEDAAKDIVYAYLCGYPQVPQILAWAARYVAPEQAILILETVLSDVLSQKIEYELVKELVMSAISLRENGEKILKSLLVHPDTYLRRIVAQRCRVREQYILHILEELSVDEDPLVRIDVVYSCAYLFPESKNLLLSLAQDDAQSVRKTALDVLSRCEQPKRTRGTRRYK